LGSPWAAAGSSFVTFAAGALIPLIPFWFGSGGGVVVASAILSILALFAIGSGMSYLTGRSFLVSGLRMMLIGAAAAAVTYAVGSLLEVGTGI
ncbi:MAG TPA: VIT1/CCC1 transporter family protein, partial [Actinomycetota bacterium]|nr:VIT1/CCC1 transporter family protein [Actinomycetota bacterium]